MKVICKNCGCHFPEDFEETLKMPCNYWGDKGLANLPIKDKKKFWKWLFTAPFDEFLVKYNISIGMELNSYFVTERVKFEDIVENWNELLEEDKKKFQREYFLKYKDQVPSLKIYYDPKKGL